MSAGGTGERDLDIEVHRLGRLGRLQCARGDLGRVGRIIVTRPAKLGVGVGVDLHLHAVAHPDLDPRRSRPRGSWPGWSKDRRWSSGARLSRLKVPGTATSPTSTGSRTTRAGDRARRAGSAPGSVCAVETPAAGPWLVWRHRRVVVGGRDVERGLGPARPASAEIRAVGPDRCSSLGAVEAPLRLVLVGGAPAPVPASPRREQRLRAGSARRGNWLGSILEQVLPLTDQVAFLHTDLGDPAGDVGGDVHRTAWRRSARLAVTVRGQVARGHGLEPDLGRLCSCSWRPTGR